MPKFTNYLAQKHCLLSPTEEALSVEQHLADLELYRLGLIKKEVLEQLKRFFAFNPHILGIRIGGDRPEDEQDPFYIRAQTVDGFIYTPDFEANHTEQEIQEASSEYYASLFDWDYSQKNIDNNFLLNTIDLENDKHFSRMFPFTVYSDKLEEFTQSFFSPEQHVFFAALEQEKIDFLKTEVPTKNTTTKIQKI